MRHAHSVLSRNIIADFVWRIPKRRRIFEYISYLMDESLRIELLGTFRVLYGGKLVTDLDAPRLQALLAYLVLKPGAPQSRQRIAFTFWPDSTEKQALTNLRQLLHHFRRALPEATRFIEADTKTLLWKVSVPFALDVAQFKQAAVRTELFDESIGLAILKRSLEEAVQLYTGDLLPDCYDEWIESEREALLQHYLTALDRLSSLLEQQRSYQEAMRYARLLLLKNPLRETAYRCLMRLHAIRLDRAGALQVYHECVTVLNRELDVAPDPATRELYEQILTTETNTTPDTTSRSSDLAAATPLIGRQAEWLRLREAWRLASNGRAHIVSIAGDAGIGKTRLAEELRTWTARQGITTAWTRCYAAEGRLAFAPVADWLRSGTLRRAIDGLDAVWRTEVARILPELQVQDPHHPGLEPPAENWQRRRFFEAMARSVLASHQPILLLIDDLPWCDRETLEWIHYLLRFDSGARLLIVGTIRSEDLGPDHALEALLLDLRRTGRLTEIVLDSLDAVETTALAEQVANHSFEASQAAYLYRETEGNPLFVVEGVRAGLMGGDRSTLQTQLHTTAPPGMGSLPPRVQAVLAARLAQLSLPARELASLAATIGRAFTFPVLLAASGHGEDALVSELDELWKRKIIREHGASGYDFSHDKLREAAYMAESPVRRRLLHRHVAKALANLHGEDLDAVAGQLAAHFDQGGLPEKALPFYRRAALVAQRLHAEEEAISHLNRALSLLPVLPDDSSRKELEVELLVLLGPNLVATRGWADPEVGQVYTRARSLCRSGIDPMQQLPILWGLRTFHIVQAELEEVRVLGEEFLHLAENQHNATLLTAAHLTLAISRFHLGDLLQAREHLEISLDFYGSRPQTSHVFPFGPDLGVFARSYASHVLWHLGYPDAALAQSQKAYERADELKHPFSKAVAAAYSAMLHQFRREVAEARKYAEFTVALCEEHGFAYYLAWGKILRGWAQHDEGNWAKGLGSMQQGLNDLRATGAELRQPYYLGLLAETCRHDARIEEGLILLDEALAQVQKKRERWIEPELYRLKGEFLLERDPEEAQACFRSAFDMAQNQCARALSLRAAAGLSRTERQHRRVNESLIQLKSVYESFSEGFDTVDLQDARALLEK